MKSVRIFEQGDKVKIEMVIEKAYIEHGEVKYLLKDPRRMGKVMDYPLTEEEMELVEEAEQEVD